MFTIICCTIRPEAAEELRENVAATIGVPFEWLPFDNRTAGRGICSVYNECAARARYDLLCFVHEDVRFLTPGWGGRLARKLREGDCGVIGFAGSTVKLRRMTGWNCCPAALRCNYVQHMRGRGHLKRRNPGGAEFSPVVTLDGMCLFVHREVWRTVGFDERTLPGFHCYDLDFTIGAAAAGRRNYVAHGVTVEHFSAGAYSAGWLSDMQRLHAKWAGRLPLAAEPLTASGLARFNRLGEAEWMRILMQKGLFEACGLGEVKDYLRRYPLRLRSWRLLFQYAKYRRRAARRAKK